MSACAPLPCHPAPSTSPTSAVDVGGIIARLDPSRGLRIGGRARGGALSFAVLDPATGADLACVTDGDEGAAVAAVDAAADAFSAWADTAPRDRAETLRRAYDAIVDDVENLTALICAENGKSQADARSEVVYAADFFRWFGEEAVRTDGGYGVNPAGTAHTVVTHRPVGVAALITPWNFPIAMAARKIAPALAAGCTVVLKPAAETPFSALAIADLLTAVGLPGGVVNVVPTTRAEDVVSTWLSDSRIRKVSFTGSTGVGRRLLRQAADRVLNSSMELGGNAAFVVTADADVERAVDGAMTAKFRNSGQACTAANRFYVHADIADAFVERLTAAVVDLQVGPASDPSSQVGPMISARAAGNVERLVDAAVDAGAVATRGRAPDAGFFVAPVVLTGVQPDAAILQEEIFGPVAPVVVYEDEADLINWVNGTEYGLASYVYAGRTQDALRIAGRIDAGMVGINRGIVSDVSAPFGGTKQSGLGREGARIGMHEFQETQYFSVDH